MKFFIITVLLGCAYFSKAQSSESLKRAPQVIYANIGGSSPFIALHYDRRFFKRVNGPGFGAGFGMIGGSGSWRFSVPVAVNYLMGKKNHFAEFAAGATWMNNRNDFNHFPDNEEGFIWHVNAGYRLQLPNSIMVRAGFSPIRSANKIWYNYYLGVGWGF